MLSVTISCTIAWGTAGVPGFAPFGRYLQYGSIGSTDPSAKFQALSTPPAPRLQLIPLEGVVPSQVTASVALGVTPSASNTAGDGL